MVSKRKSEEKTSTQVCAYKLLSFINTICDRDKARNIFFFGNFALIITTENIIVDGIEARKSNF